MPSPDGSSDKVGSVFSHAAQFTSSTLWLTKQPQRSEKLAGFAPGRNHLLYHSGLTDNEEDGFLFLPLPNKALVHPHPTSADPVTLGLQPLRPDVHVEEEAPFSPTALSVWVSQSKGVGSGVSLCRKV